MSKQSGDQESITVVYDDRCPICRFYCTRVELEDSVGRLELVDARKNGKILQEITQAGLDIDQGMVVKHNGKIYHGYKAINELAKLGKSAGLAGCMSACFFRSQTLAAVLYPLSRSLRNIFLKLLGKTKINNLNN